MPTPSAPKVPSTPSSSGSEEQDAKEAAATAPEKGETTSTFDTSHSGGANVPGDHAADKGDDDTAALAAVAPALANTATLDEADTYGDPSNLKADRVFREGDIDFNSVSDTSHTAQGSRYPLTPERAEGLAASLEAEADAAEAEAELKRDAAERARAEADRIRSSVDTGDDNRKVS